MIVYTRGRTRHSDEDYHASEPATVPSLPIIVLVNRNSASASEIVSGALQDHDRSLIVGETTFGKALVQSVYRVNQSAGAAITTARYYTPSGRLIQRPWDGTFDEYLTYTLREQDANKVHKAEDLKYTDGGRKVYSGGGIEPDRRFDGPVQGFNPTKFGRALYARNIFDTYAQRFSRKGDTRIGPAPAGARELAQDFVLTDVMVDEFKALVKTTGLKVDEAAWQQDLPFIKAMMRFEIDSDLFGIAVASEDLAKADPQLQFGLGLFSEADALLQLGRQSQTTRRASR
jgi:carboxyl-terminal processing protease